MIPYILEIPPPSTSMFPETLQMYRRLGTWVAQVVKCLPSAQVMIPGSWDEPRVLG